MVFLKSQAQQLSTVTANLLFALEALVGLLSIVQPAGVVDRDLIARSGRVGTVTTGNNLSLDAHCGDVKRLWNWKWHLEAYGGWRTFENEGQR